MQWYLLHTRYCFMLPYFYWSYYYSANNFFNNFQFFSQASINGFVKYFQCTKTEAIEYMKLSAVLVKEACEEFWNDYTRFERINRLIVSGITAQN